MSIRVGSLIACLRRFRRNVEGVALTETLVVLPVVVLFSFAITEFGTFLGAKSRVEAGVRDAARYLSRCTDDFGCTVEAAKNIAVYGNISGTGAPRVQDWTTASITITPSMTPGNSATWPAQGGKLRVETDFEYFGSLLLSALKLDLLRIRTYHEDIYWGR